MSERKRGSSTATNDRGQGRPHQIFNVHGVRYQVADGIEWSFG